MKNDNNEVIVEVDESHYEDWEFDYTNNMVEEFLENEIMPALEKFDFSNRDENYVPGVASFTLYTRLIELLVDNGWTTDELKEAIDDFGNIATGSLH